jgi:hypothetical protein
MGMVDTVLRRLANASATAHPTDVLGVNYYGGAANGYRHVDMQETFAWMDEYATAAPPRSAPLADPVPPRRQVRHAAGECGAAALQRALRVRRGLDGGRD